MITRQLVTIAMALLASACSQEQPTATESASTAAQTTDPIQAAIRSQERLASDREEDSWRKPDAVLRYLEVRPGMHVIDYFAAGGYFTELLARAVGPSGRVIAFNNEPYLKYAADKPAQRYAGERLANVTPVTSAPEQLELAPASLDAALFVLSYHDLHWRSKDGSWPVTDAHAALGRLASALKPGAVVVVLDHVAPAGSDPATSVEALHRIDPAVIRRDFEAAGFTFEGESDVFRSASDDYSKPVFDPAVRRNTDRIMYKFRKPG